jgi:hypothetical protein
MAKESDGDSPREIIDADGRPTRLMDPDQYKVWVRQEVSGNIWAKFATILSVVGLGTVLTIVTWFGSTSTSTLENKLTNDIEKRSGAMQRDLLERSSAMQRELNQSLSSAMLREVQVAVATPQLAEGIAKNALALLQKEEGIEKRLSALIVKRSQEILGTSTEHAYALRTLALQQILLFGDPKEKADAVSGVLLDLNSRDEFDLAVRNFQLVKDGRDVRLLVHNIIQRASTANSALGASAWQELQTIFTDNAHVADVGQFIKFHVRSRLSSPSAANRQDPDAQRRIVDIFAQANGLVAATHFVDWIESDDERLASLGLHGLTRMPARRTTSPEDTLKRQLLAQAAIHALARAGLPRNELNDKYLSAVSTAIRSRNFDQLRGLSESVQATPAIRNLLDSLVDGADAQAWAFVNRHLATMPALATYGRYGEKSVSAQASRGIANLVDTSAGSTDWEQIAGPILNNSSESWTRPGVAHLLVNAFARALQPASNPKIADELSRLHAQAHLAADPYLFSDNLASYRMVARQASMESLTWLLDQAPEKVGRIEPHGPNLEARSFVDGIEATILGVALQRRFRTDGQAEADLLSRMSAALGAGDHGRSSRSYNIWFLAVAKAADVTLPPDASARGQLPSAVFNALSDRIKRNARVKIDPPIISARLLSLLANHHYLAIPTLRRSAELANLHLLASSIGAPGDTHPSIGNAALVISENAKKAFGWPGSLPLIAAQYVLDAARRNVESVPLIANEAWLAFQAPKEQVIQFEVTDAVEVDYILVAPSGTVQTSASPSIQPGSTTVFRVRSVSTELNYLRLRVSPRAGATSRVSARFETFFAAGTLRGRGQDIVPVNIDSSVTIETQGNDEAWLRLNVEANATYVLRTLRLNSSGIKDETIDTVIEVYDSDERDLRWFDDDGGDRREPWSSQLSLSTDRATQFHVRIKNISRARGTYDFEVTRQGRQARQEQTP